MERKKRGLCLIFIPLCILIAFIFCFDKYLDYKFEKDYSNLMSTYYGEPVKDTGIAFQEKGLKSNDLMIFGSSELGTAVAQNPKNIFPNKLMPFNGNVIGKAHYQDLIHSINIGGLDEGIKDAKVVYIVSIQWFISDTNENDLNKDGFASNFSDLKYYNYIHNDKISDEDKVETSQRVAHLLKAYPTKNQDYIYARLNASDKLSVKALKTVMEPYYFLRNKFLTMKDKYKSIEVVQYVKGKSLKPRDLSWKDENIKAEIQAKEASKNNDLYISDAYYEKYLRGKMDKLKDTNKNVNLNGSKEWDDFKLFLDTCKQTGVKPYIVIMPVNGQYYDHTGLTKDQRFEFYNKIEKMSSEYGFTSLNLKDKEYEPYFMMDVMHLGWKGWIHIDEKIANHFSKNEK